METREKNATLEGTTEDIDFKALYIQTLADYENLQKRTQKQIQHNSRKIFSEVLAPFLEVYQDVKNGLKYDTDNIGLELIYSKYVKTLKSFNINIIDSTFIMDKLDNQFSPDYMNAMSVMKTDDERLHNTIATIVSDGFIHDDGTVIQHAYVVVYQKK